MPTGTKKTCPNGHTYYKSSDCPTCPQCENGHAPKDGLLSMMGAPARRALEREGITSVEKLSSYTEAEILKLHGMGPASLPKLRKALEDAGLGFRG